MAICQVEQEAEGRIVGGSADVVWIAGNKPFPPALSGPSAEEPSASALERARKSLPPCIRNVGA